MTDAQLLAEIILYIKTGGKNTMAAGLRQVLNDFVASKQNISEKGIASGYAALNSSAKLDTSLLSVASPSLYKFLRDDGVYTKFQNTFKGAGGQILDKKYTIFEFVGTSAAWVFPAPEKDKIYFLINKGSGTLTVNSTGGSSVFVAVSGGSATNTFSLALNSYAIIIDDGDQLIVITPSVGGAAAWGSITGTLSDQTDLDTALSSLTTSISTKISTALTSGKILIGNGSNIATAQTVSGDGTITNAGVLSLDQTVIVGLQKFFPLFNSFATVGNTTTTETDLVTNTIASNTLVNNADKLEAEYGGSFVSSGTATRQVRLYFSGSLIFDTGTLTLSLSSAWTMYVTIIRVSSSIVRYMVSLTTQGAALSAYTAVGELTGLNLATTNILKITGQAAGVGAATNDIISVLSMVNYLKKA